MLNGVNADVTPELKTTLDDLRRTLAIVDDVLKNGINGTLTHVNTALDELRGPLATANVVLKNADTTLLNNNAPVQQDLRDALQEVSRAARSLRGLTDYLERHPDSLIRGKSEEKR